MCWLLVEQGGATVLLLAKTLLVLVVWVVPAIANRMFPLRSLPRLLACSTIVCQGSIGDLVFVSSSFFALTFFPLDT